ncbi:MAG: hypothetical protein Q8N63_05315 [Nanoarchaeota archaeon]|nr:hypothetical protein [Nanoarchaeota archaeon]
MAKRTNRPSVINMSYATARSIIADYNESNESYLRSMVRMHIPNAENELACADRKYLLHMARTIKGVAKKVNDYDKEILSRNQDVLDRIKSLSQITDSTERELLDERICLQLEGRKIPDNCSLSNAYIGTKNSLR